MLNRYDGSWTIVKRLTLNKTKIAMLDENLNWGHQKMSHGQRRWCHARLLALCLLLYSPPTPHTYITQSKALSPVWVLATNEHRWRTSDGKHEGTECQSQNTTSSVNRSKYETSFRGHSMVKFCYLLSLCWQLPHNLKKKS